VGGRLFLTNERLIFSPTIVDRLLKAKEWSCARSEVLAVTVAPRTTAQPLSGGMRHRLCVETSDGSVEQFVVNNVDQAVADLHEAIFGG
jgi:hypothetical protein